MYNIPMMKIQLVKEGKIPSESRPLIKTPDNVAEIMFDLCELHAEEHFYCLLLNTKNRVNGIQNISTGSLSAAIIHPREVFKAALLANSAAVILCHNHPSGDPTPSPEDITLTKKIVDAGKFLDIPILDHLVIGDRRYISFKEQNLI